MNTKMQILLAVITAVAGSFLQTPSNHFQMTFNSTFLNGSEKLFRPIVIPNASVNLNETLRGKENELILRKILQPGESTLKENYLSDQPKATKFSSRYSTNQDEPLGRVQREKTEKSTEGYSKSTQIPSSERNENSHEGTSTTEIHKSFLNNSNESEEEKEDIDESREAEETEISSTTSEPYSELQRSTSFRNSDEDHRSYETTSPAEEEDSSEEHESEDKRSVEDYDNSGSKNYHSIQTPLESIKYKGAHAYGEDFERLRTRLVGSIRRRPSNHNWPYSRAQVKQELEKLNEISDSDESYQKSLKEGIKEELKSIHNNPELESAVKKDELKFDRNKKYNYIEERNRRKQQQKGLIAEEEKDHSIPLLESLKQYKVDKEHPKHQTKVSSTPKLKESIRSTNPPHITTPKDLFRTPKKLGVSSDLTLNFQGREFLGPVVFNQNNKGQERIKPSQRLKPIHRPGLKDLEEKEKLDQDNQTNQRFQKSVFGSESKVSESFNHLEESNEMYNAILANIQSVFGLRTQPLKSGSGAQNVITKASLAESKLLTWSTPLKGDKVR